MFDDLKTEEFFLKLKKRNKDAFKLLYERFKIPLFSLINSLTRDRDVTADLLQDTFLKIIKNINQLNNINKIEFWIYRIATNTTLNYFKKNNRYVDYDFNFDLVVYEDEKENKRLDEMIKKADYDEVLRLIDELPVKQGLVFSLKYIENFKEKEIAEILNIPLGTVKSRLNSAREKLKKLLNK